VGAQARLTPPALDIAAGQTATVQVAIRNTGVSTDRFSVEMVRGTPSWIYLPATTLTLLPYEETSLPLTITPARSPDVPAGATSFAIRITSSEDPDDQIRVSGTVNVGAYSDVTIELVPKTLTGRLAARAQVTVTNASNIAFQGELSGRDPDLALGMSFSPGDINVAAGAVVTAGVVVRPRHRILRGIPVTHAFTVALTETHGAERDFFGDPTGPPVTGEEGEAATLPAPAGVHPPEVTVAGSMVQGPVAPDRSLPVAAVVALILVVALVGWFALVRPQIRSSVQSEVRHELAADGLTAGTEGRSGTSSSARSGVSVNGPASTAGGLTVNGSLLAAGNGTQSYTVPVGKNLEISDLLVQNAAGDSGVVALAQGDRILMQWSLANFRDLDYHWITPIVIGPGVALQLQTSGCTDTCTPGLYYAGALVPANP
jgi:hypothetical protein